MLDRGDPLNERTPVAIVTGAARGMGALTAARLARRGFAVALIDHPDVDVPGPYRTATVEELERAAAACEGRGFAHVADVRDAAALSAVVDAAVEHHGHIDVIVAAAGAMAGGSPLWQTDDDVWRSMIEINLTGVFNLARAAIPAMLSAPEPRRGRIVAVASAAAHEGLPMLSAYTAAKHGVAGLVRALAGELGSTGITANAVCPGSTDTEMLVASSALYGLTDRSVFKDQARIGRLIDPDEIAATIEWLAVDAPSAMTGALIDVDGGFRG